MSPHVDPGFLGLSEAWWQQLLNGSLGAMAGAVVAVVAIVATIGTQRRLFAIERAETYTANLLADRKRKADLDRQLTAQREDVREQIAVQIIEASRQREIAAMADLLRGANQSLRQYAGGHDAIKELLVSMDFAAIRWSFEVADEELAEEIEHWPNFLALLASHVYDTGLTFENRMKNDPEGIGLELHNIRASGLSALLRPSSHSDDTFGQEYDKVKNLVGEEHAVAIEALSSAVSVLRRISQLCAKLPQDERSGMHTEMRAARTRIETSLGP